MKKTMLILAAVVMQTAAHAQTVQLQAGVPPTLEVQRLAPQLVVFAGGDVNFANLVNGLAFGVPVTLTTPLQTGLTEIVTFTPTGAMTPLAIAQTLESARQALIARGVAIPTAQQLGVALAGGTLATAGGSAQVNPLVTTATPVGTATATTNPSLLQSGVTLRNTSDSLLQRGISDTPPNFAGTSTTPPRPLSAATSNPAAPFAGGTAPTTTPATATTTGGTGTSAVLGAPRPFGAAR
jgi:hypothetical protein